MLLNISAKFWRNSRPARRAVGYRAGVADVVLFKKHGCYATMMTGGGPRGGETSRLLRDASPSRAARGARACPTTPVDT